MSRFIVSCVAVVGCLVAGSATTFAQHCSSGGYSQSGYGNGYSRGYGGGSVAYNGDYGSNYGGGYSSGYNNSYNNGYGYSQPQYNYAPSYSSGPSYSNPGYSNYSSNFSYGGNGGHYDYQPATVQQHRNHLDYTPAHFDFNSGGHSWYR